MRSGAQGAQKTPDQWNEFLADVWTMRDAKMNPSAAKAFGQMNAFAVAQSIAEIESHKDALLKALPLELRGVVEKRFDALKEYGEIAKTFERDYFKPEYADELLKHYNGLRQAGIEAALPKELKQTSKTGDSRVKMEDENGKAFDHLRGQGSITKQVADYIKAAGGDYNVVRYWMRGQAGSSWSAASQGFKYFVAGNRTVDASAYYWHDGEAFAKSQYEGSLTKVSEAVFRTSHTAYHAFNLLFLRRVDFRHNDRAGGVVQLIRTEDRDVMKMYALKNGAKGVRMKRGAAESFSIYKKVSVRGTELTVQKMPHHRILGIYFHEEKPESGLKVFLGDGENEFVCLPEGVEFDYDNNFTGY